MQKVLYRDDPYIVLWYNVNLQAFRTDRWAGYVLAPAGDGAPFWNQLRSTYISLRPLRAARPAAGGLQGLGVGRRGRRCRRRGRRLRRPAPPAARRTEDA